MKKRKELNALIGLGDSKRKKTKKGSGHRLLRTEPPDSESESSSEDEEFNNMNRGANFGKRSYTQCCNVCYPLFLFIILAACVMACAGLIWMQIALKEDLDSLKEKLHSMESSQKASSSEIPKLSEDLKNKERKIDDMESGDKGLSKLWSNLTEMNRKISLLDSAVNHLKSNLKSAADLISLPTTVEELQKSVATIGSTLTSVQHDVKTMQAALETQSQDQDSKKTTDLTTLRKTLGEANKTEEERHTWTSEQIHLLLSTVADLQLRVMSLENGSEQTVKNEAAPASPQAEADGADAASVTETTGEEGTTTRATPEAEQEVSTAQTDARARRRPRFLSPKRSQRSSDRSRTRRCPHALTLPPGATLKDVQDVFRQSGVGPTSPGLTLQDLRRRVFGTLTPDDQTLDCFDSDRDGRFSLTELTAALGP